MKTWTKLLFLWAAVVLAAAAGPRRSRADEPAKDKPKAPKAGTLVVTDQAGKEHKLKTWKFVTGTIRLPWLASPAVKGEKPKDADKSAQPAAGPEALVLREENSTGLQEGIITYVLLDRIRAIEYDPEKKTVTVRYARPGDKGDEEGKLTGTTRYVGVNKLTIQAEADLGELGVADVKFQGGVPKGVKSIRFPAPKAAAKKAAGRLATVTDVEKNVHKVADLQPLYRLAGGRQRRIPTLLFKKTVKIDVGKIKKLAFVESGEKGGEGLDYEVTLKTGKSHTLALINQVNPLDGKAALLEGFVGRVEAGYKFIPLSPSPNQVFTEIQFEDAKAEPKGEGGDKEDARKKDKG
jgi:hypothetical protein